MSGNRHSMMETTIEATTYNGQRMGNSDEDQGKVRVLTSATNRWCRDGVSEANRAIKRIGELRESKSSDVNNYWWCRKYFIYFIKILMIMMELTKWGKEDRWFELFMGIIIIDDEGGVEDIVAPKLQSRRWSQTDNNTYGWIFDEMKLMIGMELILIISWWCCWSTRWFFYH